MERLSAEEHKGTVERKAVAGGALPRVPASASLVAGATGVWWPSVCSEWGWGPPSPRGRVSLQIQMYQLSRLLHDHHRDLHDHLEEREVGPSLYAAPWFLTVFASQFPLGFVARVFGECVRGCLQNLGSQVRWEPGVLSPWWWFLFSALELQEQDVVLSI